MAHTAAYLREDNTGHKIGPKIHKKTSCHMQWVRGYDFITRCWVWTWYTVLSAAPVWTWVFDLLTPVTGIRFRFRFIELAARRLKIKKLNKQ